MKKGRFTLEEIDYLKDNSKVLTIEQMAKELDRDPISVKAFVEQKIGLGSQQRKEVEASEELKMKPYWNELKRQFNEEELEMFEFHWKKMWSQFKDDVFHTEEIQIIDTIKLEILMNRDLSRQQEITQQINDINSLMENEKDKPKTQQDGDLLMNCRNQLANLSAAAEIVSKDYRELQTKKQSMIKELKGTREQRIKDIESSKQTFAGLLKQITQNSDFRHEVGLEMEKMRLAMYKERDRLAEEHKYEDGDFDQPLLTAETVL